MAEVVCGTKGRMTRFYSMSVATTPIGIPSTHLTGRNGQQVNRAVCRIGSGTVRMGVLGMLTPSATAGFPLAAADILVLEGHDNIKLALFVQDGGASTLSWMLEAPEQ